ncbi:MAG TPA: ATP synthase F1 subunit epsilon [Blastocatellia bacterium]|nr:ATP synthase F1 subunit epsilon [Blastocatellia bacterium]
MRDKIQLSIIAPEGKVFEADVDRVEVPGLDGELGILPGHTELISLLKPDGLLTYHIGASAVEVSVDGGFVEVGPDRVVVLANKAEQQIA